MNSRRTAKITLKSSWRLAHYRAIQTCPNPQNGKIFKSIVTTIKIKCSNNFPRRYTVEITYTSLGIKRKFHDMLPWKRLFPSVKIALQRVTNTDWSDKFFKSIPQVRNELTKATTFWKGVITGIKKFFTQWKPAYVINQGPKKKAYRFDEVFR